MDAASHQRIIRQAYSVAYSLCRIGDNLPNSELKSALESRGVAALTSALEEDSERSAKTLRELEYLVAFGRDTGRIDGHIAELVLAEVEKAYFTYKHSPRRPMSGEDLFPRSFPEVGSIKSEAQQVPPSVSTVLPPKEASESVPDLGAGFNLRKDKIVERIRQSGNANGLGCRMRDIQEALPDISERTLRYDLQRLVSEGLLERIGSSGPSTYYRMRQA